MNTTEPLLTVQEAAKLLKAPVSWLYDRTRKDAVPLIRLGKYVRLQKTSLLRWARLGCPENWREVVERWPDLDDSN